MQKIAVLSDIHGNVMALSAVVADVSKEKPDQVWLLGDLVMPGPGVDDIFALLNELPVTVNIRGNWEDLLLQTSSHELELSKPSRIFFARTAEYVLEHLSTKNLDFIKAQTATDFKLVQGLRFSISHALPDKNFGQELIATADSKNFAPLFEATGADIALYGHVHHQLLRYSEAGQLIINPGSIGQPFFRWNQFRRDLRAQYCLISVDEAGYADIHFKKISYDHQAEYELAKARELPYLALYKELLEKGIAHTHDYDIMNAQNSKYHYAEDIMKFYEK